MRRLFDNVVSLVVILIILMLIIPMHPALLDFLILVNISLSFIILLITMYVKDALEFSIFPSLLLVTTIFRLALNVSSTRLILGNSGSAGNVIQAFGTFVIGDNVAVGLIIFLIIVIIQFIVITKGAERVAEVSARFTLDAMPGKQMAIDADLNTGVINEQQARERRENISREAEFYGSMDGATKFVKGDAIISLLVSVVNLIGGLIIGYMNGVQDIVGVYTSATVGDGLVSQIPALLISTATGMIVTRAASKENLSKDILQQFSRVPLSFLITGGLMLAMTFIPQFPWQLLLFLGIVWLSVGLILMRNARRMEAAVPAADEALAGAMETEMTEMELMSDPKNIYKLIEVEAIEILFGYSLLPIIDDEQGANFMDRLLKFKQKFAMDMGIVIPQISVSDNIQISPRRYIINIKGEEVADGEVLVGYYLVMDSNGMLDDIDGIDTIEPAFGIPAKWVAASNIEKPSMLNYSVVDPQSVILMHLSEVIRKHAHEFVGRYEMSQLIENVKRNNKVLIDEVITGGIVSVSVLNKIVVNLLKEDIPVKDMVTIIETAADNIELVNGDADLLTEYVRTALKRTITKKYAEDGVIRVVMLDPELENNMLKTVNKTAAGGVSFILDPATIQNIYTSITENLKKLDEVGASHIVVTSRGVRIYFKRFIEQFIPDLIVLSFDEIDSKIELQTFGMIK